MTKWTLTLMALALFLLPACGKEEKAAPAPTPASEAPEPRPDRKVACKSIDDCRTGQVSLDGRCLSANSTKTVFTDRKNAVTPERVKRELEKQTKIRQKQLDRGLDMVE